MTKPILMVGDVIKHKNSLDIAGIVVGAVANEVQVEWINLGEINSWSIGQSGSLEITEDWLICTTYRPACYRHASWRQL